jgi:hypothetical protein
MSAVATITAGLPQLDVTQGKQTVVFTVALTGNYGGASTNGDTIDLSQLGVNSAELPIEVRFYETTPAGDGISGYFFRYQPGTTQANGVLSVWTAAGAQYSEGSAYGTPPFSITGFALQGEASFPLFV